MTDEQNTYTDKENPELAGLFSDLYEPACLLFKRARLSVPENHAVEVAEHAATGQAFVTIPLAADALARCAIQTSTGGVFELGFSKVEESYRAAMDSFRHFGVEHMLRAKKITKAHREGTLGLLVVVVVGESRVRLVALLGNDPAKHVVLCELTGDPQPVMVN